MDLDTYTLLSRAFTHMHMHAHEKEGNLKHIHMHRTHLFYALLHTQTHQYVFPTASHDKAANVEGMRREDRPASNLNLLSL